jgi:hypothetical protein
VADTFRAYRPWFWAAVVYNVTWGVSVVVYPRWLLWFVGSSEASAPLAQSVGMMVAVYAYGYYLLARDPERYAPFIWIALAGKIFGAVGFLYCALAGGLPARFGVVTLMNDVIWLPAFWAFALRHARVPS